LNGECPRARGEVYAFLNMHQQALQDFNVAIVLINKVCPAANH
jgi:hypothetical protein